MAALLFPAKLMKEGVELEWRVDKVYISERKRLAAAAGGVSWEMQKAE